MPYFFWFCATAFRDSPANLFRPATARKPARYDERRLGRGRFVLHGTAVGGKPRETVISRHGLVSLLSRIVFLRAIFRKFPAHFLHFLHYFQQYSVKNPCNFAMRSNNRCKYNHTRILYVHTAYQIHIHVSDDVREKGYLSGLWYHRALSAMRSLFPQWARLRLSGAFHLVFH